MGKPFKRKVVIVTGASRGIGEQLAYLLAAQRARLVLAARNTARLGEVAARCRALGAEVLVVPADLSREEACRAVVRRAVEQFGALDVLLYNAGTARPGRFAAAPDLAGLRQEMAVNYFGLAACAHEALPHLRATRGRIVGVASFNSFFGMGGTIGYNSSKHAMRGFLNTLRNELRGTGITVTTVYPGAVAGERLQETMGANAARVPSMSSARCARLILKAAAGRRREVVLTLLGKLLVLIGALFPALLDRQFAQVADLYIVGEELLPAAEAAS
jgi:short-subunit dehydrogenase